MPKHCFLALSLVAMVPSALAGQLIEGYEKALNVDPAFQAARSELEGGRLSSTIAGRAYWPELGIRLGERAEVQGSQRTVQIAQPVLSAERYATMRGAPALEARAEATMRQRQAELAQRYFTTVTELVRSREALRLNKAKHEALAQQAKGAERALQAGTGTLTDVQDTKVRLEQVRAEALTLEARRGAAERQYAAMTGESASADGFALVRERRKLVLPPLEGTKDQAHENNPTILVARQNEKLAELDIVRKQGAFLPTISFVAKQTRLSNGQSANYAGVQLDYPLQTSSYLNVSVARTAAQKAAEEARAAEQKALLDVERLHAIVVAGHVEADIRLSAIESAKLSVTSNEKSFKGGVRSKLDILNAIQVLFQVEEEHVASRLRVGESLLELHTKIGTPIGEALSQVEAQLF